MRRLVAGASVRCCILVTFLAIGGPARAFEWHDLNECIAEPEQTTVRADSRRLAVGNMTFYADHGIYRNFNVGAILSVVDGTVTPWGTSAASWQGFVIGARIQF